MGRVEDKEDKPPGEGETLAPLHSVELVPLTSAMGEGDARMRETMPPKQTSSDSDTPPCNPQNAGAPLGVGESVAAAKATVARAALVQVS